MVHRLLQSEKNTERMEDISVMGSARRAVVWCSIMVISAVVFGFRLKRVNKELEPVWQEFEKN